MRARSCGQGIRVARTEDIRTKNANTKQKTKQNTNKRYCLCKQNSNIIHNTKKCKHRHLLMKYMYSSKKTHVGI